MIINYILFIFCPIICIIFHCSIILSIKFLFKNLNYVNLFLITLILFLSHIAHNILYAFYYQYLVNTSTNINIIIKKLSGLNSFFGIDFIIFKQKILFVDINPRITTSYKELSKNMKINVAQQILNTTR